jgi:hypothetical protein
MACRSLATWPTQLSIRSLIRSKNCTFALDAPPTHAASPRWVLSGCMTRCPEQTEQGSPRARIVRRPGVSELKAWGELRTPLSSRCCFPPVRLVSFLLGLYILAPSRRLDPKLPEFSHRCVDPSLTNGPLPWIPHLHFVLHARSHTRAQRSTGCQVRFR